MAYNKAFNPDALPAHASPEEAALALSKLKDQRRRSRTPPVSSSTTANNTSKPARLETSPHRQENGRTSTSNHQRQSSRPPPSPNPTPARPASQNQNRYSSPPPPQNYGHGPRPSVGAQQRPKSSIMPPRSPMPPPQISDEANLFPLFRAANTSGSGTLSERELSSALVNGDYTSFDPYTIKCLLRMFSSTPSKSHLSYEEFLNLWRFLAAWRELFERFDEDHSGGINLQEFGKALVAFGYRLSPVFTAVLYNTFNDRGGMSRASEGMSFDLFVQACISLKRMTDVFKGYDDDRDGYITLSFEEFLTEILRLKE